MNNQFNAITCKAYGGGNQVKLQSIKNEQNYKSDAWLTFIQAKTEGLAIIKGSKAVCIFKGYRMVDQKRTIKGETDIISVCQPLVHAYVFNMDQTEKIEVKKKIHEEDDVRDCGGWNGGHFYK